MDNALNILFDRQSEPSLTEPGPSDEQLNIIFSAALRAPDHCRVRPWRFLVIKGDRRRDLGQLLVDAEFTDDPNMTTATQDALLKAPLRAPVLVALVNCLKEHPKVPEIEQVLSMGSVAYGMLLAAFGLGLGAIWRTGHVSYHPTVAKGLGLSDNERLCGFIYLGAKGSDRPPKKRPESIDFVSHW